MCYLEGPGDPVPWLHWTFQEMCGLENSSAHLGLCLDCIFKKADGEFHLLTSYGMSYGMEAGVLQKDSEWDAEGDLHSDHPLNYSG